MGSLNAHYVPATVATGVMGLGVCKFGGGFALTKPMIECDRCDNDAHTHKYDERLCTTHFYDAWRERHGYD